MTKVKRTAICAMTLLSFFNPGIQKAKAAPKAKGITQFPMCFQDIPIILLQLNKLSLIYLLLMNS